MNAHPPGRPTNRLARATSPYLLQHAHNPVDWYPWSAEAFERAKREDKPIFLSVGYSACHWCHVMERESFENDAIARLMNEHYVNVKVDREERPDVDEIYMKAVQALSGQGGWPMSVFLTPELEPFFGGTYFPPHAMYGRPSFADVLTGLARAWRNDRDKLLRQGRRLAERIADEGRADTAGSLDPLALERSLSALEQAFDPLWGGFGDAPKFPHAMDLRLLLRHALRTGSEPPLKMAIHTLSKMANGGMYDQLGGGFHRYSTDREWLIPHFEKMLYDNALLVPAYLEAYLITHEERFARVARECCEWALREMRTKQGAFASSQDADSEGVEGKFFAWTPSELSTVLGARRGAWACEWFGVSESGNFEHGASALWLPETPETVAEQLGVPLGDLQREMESARVELLAARRKRVAPETDDKVLASWNGLMISALAQAHQVLDEGRYLAAAQAAARFVLEHMRQPDGRLFATSRNGQAHIEACLDDYAFLIAGLVDLYESDFDEGWLREALTLEAILAERFRDEERGGYFTTGRDHELLIARLKNPQDGALPSGNAVHALNLLRLADLTGKSELAERAQSVIVSLGAIANSFPAAFGQLWLAVDFLRARGLEIVLAGDLEHGEGARMLRAVRSRFLPSRVVARAHADADEVLLPLLRGRRSRDGAPLAFVCRGWSCSLPASSVNALQIELDQAVSATKS